MNPTENQTPTTQPGAPMPPAPSTATTPQPQEQAPTTTTTPPLATTTSPTKKLPIGLILGIGGGIVIVLIIVFLVLWIFILSPQAQAKRLSNAFMADITKGNVAAAVSLTGDPTSSGFLTTASSKLHGSYSLSESSFTRNTGYYIYAMSGASEKYARVIITNSQGKREVSSLVYSNALLALIPGTSSSTSNTSTSGSNTSSSPASSATTTAYTTYTNSQFNFSFKYPSSWGTLSISTTTGSQGGANGVSSYDGTFSNKPGSSYSQPGSTYPYLFQINSFKWAPPIGSDVLPDEQKLVIEISKVIRLGFLQQNAYHATDTYVPIQKQLKMMEIIVYLNDATKKLINLSIPISQIMELGLFQKLVKMKFDIPNDKLEMFEEYKKDIDNAIDTVKKANGINA